MKSALGANYCLSNDSGHSGMDPLIGSVFFVPLFMFGVLHILISSGRDTSAWLLSVIGICGAGFGLFIHKMGIMQDYNYWVKREPANQNPHADILVLGYLLGVLLLLLLTLILCRKNISKGDQKP